MARNFCGFYFALLFLLVIIQHFLSEFVQAMSQPDDCPSDAPCGTHKSDYRWSKRYGYLIRHNRIICVCHPRRLRQQKQSSEAIFVANEPIQQKQSSTLKRSYNTADSLSMSTAKHPPHTCPSSAPCGNDFGDQKRRGFYLIYKGSYCFCSPRLHRPRQQPKRDLFVENPYKYQHKNVVKGPNRSGFPKPQSLHKQYQHSLKKGREYELGSRGRCPPKAPCYVDKQPDGFC
ncbi:hypothetical protein Ddc_19596 [Ditylenchus destructor]|nr:hypothetical protein Ddc_19596 [Ditylenchus destructor]